MATKSLRSIHWRWVQQQPNTQACTIDILCLHIHTLAHTYIHLYIHTFVQYIHLNINTLTQYIHLHIHTFVHTYTCTYIHFGERSMSVSAFQAVTMRGWSCDSPLQCLHTRTMPLSVPCRPRETGKGGGGGGARRSAWTTGQCVRKAVHTSCFCVCMCTFSALSNISNPI